jgi:NADPH2:quinone reductase
MFHGRSWQAKAFGEPTDVLRLEDLEFPEPAEGTVLVKVHACGLGLPDLLMVTGNYPLLPEPPVSPGQEVAGEVVATTGNSAFSVGDRVMGLTTFLDRRGGYGDYAYLIEQKTRRVPASLTDAEAAGLLIGFRTAFAGLADRVRVAAGETLLVLGAAGSSGSSAVILGKALGATVIAAAGSEEKLAFCRGIGADHVVDYRARDIGEAVKEITDGHGADVLFDPVGGAQGTKALAGIARLGRVAVVGYASGSWLTLDPLDMVMRSYTAAGVFAAGTPEEDQVAFDRLTQLAAERTITVPVTTVASFDDVPAVIAAAQSGKPGKTVVTMN